MLNWDDPIASTKLAQAPARTAPIMTNTDAVIEPEGRTVTQHSPQSRGDAGAAEHGHGLTGLEQVEFGAHRITVDDKQMINCQIGRAHV